MINSCLCYIERGDEYLMLHRVSKDEDMNRDKWLGVGGKFEDKESQHDCVRREVFEEAGLCLPRFDYRGIVTFVSDRWETEYMHLFTAQYNGEPISDCDEGRLEWVKKSSVPSLPIWEGDRLFLALLQEEQSFFSLKLCYEGERFAAAYLNGEEIKGF